MARTEHDPISITITIPKGGKVVLTPGPHGQKHLRSVSEEDLPQVIDAIENILRAHLKGINGTICDAFGHGSKKNSRAQVALDLVQVDLIPTGGLSDKDHPDHPFGFPVHN